MKKTFSTLGVVVALLFVCQSASAQLTIEGNLFLTSPVGFNTHVGDTYSYREEAAGGITPPFSDFYGMSYSPIAPSFERKVSFGFAVTYRTKSNWEIKAALDRFSTNAGTEGEVHTQLGDMRTFYVNGVRLFGQTLSPLTNHLELSEYSPVGYFASQKLAADSITLTFARGKTKGVRFLAGIAATRYQNERVEGERQHAFIYGYMPDGSHWDNHVSLTGTSRVKGTLVGPTLGVETKKTLGKITLTAEVAETFFVGSVSKQGVWVDIDDVHSMTGPDGGPFVDRGQYIYYEGQFPLDEKETVMIPVSSLAVKLSYALSSHLSLGVGGYLKLWTNAPTAPSWVVPGRWTSFAGTGWRSERQTFALSALTGSLAYTF